MTEKLSLCPSQSTSNDSQNMDSDEMEVFTIIRNYRSQDMQLSQNSPFYSRKEKSLEELSKRFLKIFLEQAHSEISLDSVTNQLGVERRRIYDIINILESLKIVKKKEKNIYQWNGYAIIEQTIKEIGELSHEKVEVEQNEQKKKKNLERLSIGFVLIFKKKSIVTLEDAARMISPENTDELKIKTQIRRLYDIANVFKSLGLIQKVHLENKKPAFKWIGYQPNYCTDFYNFFDNQENCSFQYNLQEVNFDNITSQQIIRSSQFNKLYLQLLSQSNTLKEKVFYCQDKHIPKSVAKRRQTIILQEEVQLKKFILTEANDSIQSTCSQLSKRSSFDISEKSSFSIRKLSLL